MSRDIHIILLLYLCVWCYPSFYIVSIKLYSDFVYRKYLHGLYACLCACDCVFSACSNRYFNFHIQLYYAIYDICLHISIPNMQRLKVIFLFLSSKFMHVWAPCILVVQTSQLYHILSWNSNFPCASVHASL